MTRTVAVKAARPYTVTMGPGLLARCGPVLRETVHPNRAWVVTDSNVGPLYMGAVADSLRDAGIEAGCFTFPAGETSKSMDTLGRLLDAMAALPLTRGDCLVALGGGVVGDLAGLAAGCYMRGIPYIQLPTTLLAMVDASVGGKTAVNLSAGKNLAGLIWQPAAVLCDTACLDTLPRHIFMEGAAEAVKTAILAGEPLFSLLEGGALEGDIADIIARCVAFKAAVVAADEGETGPRRVLNLGHTIGHAIERLSGYTVPHGEAVAMGLAVMVRAARRAGDCDPASARRILDLLAGLGLPTGTRFTAGELAEAARRDKKRAGDTLTIVWPRAIGDCVLREIPIHALPGLIAGVEDTP